MRGGSGQYSEKMVLERTKHSSSTHNVLAQYLRRIHIDYHVRNEYASFWLEQLIDVLLRAESICPQSTQLVSILYLCYGFSRCAYLLYAFSRYAFLRYAYLRFGFSCYAFSRDAFWRYAYLRYAFSRYAFLRYAFSRYAFYHSVCLSAFWLAAWYPQRVFAPQLRFDACTIWIIWYQFLVIEFCRRYTFINVLMNRPWSYSQCWTGTSLQRRLMWGGFSNINDFYFFLMIFPCMSLHCKLVPVQYRECDINLFLMIFPCMSLHCKLVPVQYRENGINLFQEP